MAKLKFPENTTADQVKEVGTIVAQWFDGVIECTVLRGPSSFCAYLGIPINHPLAGFDYDDIPLSCHWGLTYGGTDLSGLTKNKYRYGWDYGHCDDVSTYDIELPILTRKPGAKNWTVGEIVQEIDDVLYDFKRLVKIAELIGIKAGVE